MSSPLGSVGRCGSSGKSVPVSPVLSPLAELSASTGSPLSTVAVFPAASSANAGSAEPTQVNSISMASSSVAPRRQRWLLLILFKTIAPSLVHLAETRYMPNRALFVNGIRILHQTLCGYSFLLFYELCTASQEGVQQILIQKNPLPPICSARGARYLFTRGFNSCPYGEGQPSVCFLPPG